MHVHQALGPGLLETVYVVTLARQVEKRGLSVQRQVTVGIEYEGQSLDSFSVPPCLCEKNIDGIMGSSID